MVLVVVVCVYVGGEGEHPDVFKIFRQGDRPERKLKAGQPSATFHPVTGRQHWSALWLLCSRKSIQLVASARGFATPDCDKCGRPCVGFMRRAHRIDLPHTCLPSPALVLDRSSRVNSKSRLFHLISPGGIKRCHVR